MGGNVSSHVAEDLAHKFVFSELEEVNGGAVELDASFLALVDVLNCHPPLMPIFRTWTLLIS